MKIEFLKRHIALAGMCIPVILAFPALADPKCDRPENWPESMTYTRFKNDGILAPDDVDFSRTSVTQIASQRTKKNLYRQVFKITYYLKNGALVEAIAVSDASKVECSMSDVIVYRIAGPASE